MRAGQAVSPRLAKRGPEPSEEERVRGKAGASAARRSGREGGEAVVKRRLGGKVTSRWEDDAALAEVAKAMRLS
jgi:hypothetical protein